MKELELNLEQTLEAQEAQLANEPRYHDLAVRRWSKVYRPVVRVPKLMKTSAGPELLGRKCVIRRS